MEVELIIGVYIGSFFILCALFTDMYFNVERADLGLSTETKNRLRLKKNSVFRKFLPKRREIIYEYFNCRVEKNKDSYMYHRVIPFFIDLFITIIIWIFATIDFFIIDFLPSEVFKYTIFILSGLYIIWETCSLIYLTNLRK